ncbi:unnamed protein product [Rotaria sordida]|uniref:Uncharacterized protein n=1 Tax=Rotaria sordida TaxID=392033 RepID=A0A814T5U7_9BILA|nr:unnamed protein product [Rotaria sordida]CAF1247518.1 unnamed protein product [Rotaria sordida]CAF3768778.1 unnamed protein product [Rotaria sordida]CAF3774064.1 unnamed protein product [Rotaria sordida]
MLIVGFVAAVPTDNGDGSVSGAGGHLEEARDNWACNDITGDFLCAGWPGAWRCQCGAACYDQVCTCKRCV